MKRAYKIYGQTGTDFWRKSNAKKIPKVELDYTEKEDTPGQTQSGEAKGYIGFKEVTCHLIFDIKI